MSIIKLYRNSDKQTTETENFDLPRDGWAIKLAEENNRECEKDKEKEF